MPIPAVNHPNWIAAKTSTPKTMDKKADGSISDFTINVLISDQSSGDPQKIWGSYIAAQYLPGDGYWMADLSEQDVDDDDFGEVKVTHWMPLPAAPAETDRDTDDDSYEDGPRIMGLAELASIAVAIDELVTGNVAEEEEFEAEEEFELEEDAVELEEEGVELEEEEVEDSYDEDVYEDED
jgi:hypothetical protein